MRHLLKRSFPHHQVTIINEEEECLNNGDEGALFLVRIRCQAFPSLILSVNRVTLVIGDDTFNKYSLLHFIHLTL